MSTKLQKKYPNNMKLSKRKKKVLIPSNGQARIVRIPFFQLYITTGVAIK